MPNALEWAFVSGAAMAVALFFPVIALIAFGLGVPRPSVRERRRIVRQIETALSESRLVWTKKEGPPVKLKTEGP